MKRLLLTVPLILMSIGCSSAQDKAVQDTAGQNITAATPIPDVGATAVAAQIKTAKPKTNAGKSAPDPGYLPVDPTGQSPEVSAAMAKVAVPPPPLNFPMPAHPKVRLTTNRGDITLQLDPKAAPLHTKSFLYLVQRHFYDGTVFHRYEDLTGKGGNIIQGGDPFTRSAATMGLAGGGGPGYQVPREVNSLTHEPLVLAMARATDPNSAGSQFYITQGPVHFLDPDYTVFGKVVDGSKAAMALRKGDTIKSAVVVK